MAELGVAQSPDSLLTPTPLQSHKKWMIATQI